MHLIRWSASPSREMSTLRDEVDRLFDSVFPSPRTITRNGATFVPPVDVEETADAYLIRADLPGVAQKDVKVTLTGETLTISGERRHESRQLHRLERLTGSFERSFVLSTPVKADGIEAVYRDGVLEIRVPKAEEAKLREIPVRVAS